MTVRGREKRVCVSAIDDHHIGRVKVDVLFSADKHLKTNTQRDKMTSSEPEETKNKAETGLSC